MNALVKTALGICICGLALPGVSQSTANSKGETVNNISHLSNLQVFEFRRYTVKAGERDHFARYFEAWFPEAMQQLGALAVGEFFERKNTNMFTWVRGFHDMDGRAIANSGLYYGPLWKEHKQTMNNLMEDSDNVLLLRPLYPERGILVLPSVDPVSDPSSGKGVVVAQIFPVKSNQLETFAKLAEGTFAKYRETGAREAGLLVTMEAPNNFPQLPVRTDGPFLVWLGILRDDRALETKLKPEVESSRTQLQQSGLLRGEPELIVLDPAPRSRLRWLQ